MTILGVTIRTRAKVAVKSVISRLPLVSAMVLMGARLPPFIKSRTTSRLFGFIFRTLKDTGAWSQRSIQTNLGIDHSINLGVPSSAPEELIFGTPKLYRGERGPLYLSSALSQHCDVFLDVGANLGYFTHFVRARNKAIPIHYFEPNDDLFNLLERNIQNNTLKNITGHNLAMGDRCGLAKFYINHTDVSSSSLDLFFANKHHVEARQTAVITFNQFVQATNLTNILAKVDIEAAEFQFLDGAEESLTQISYLIIEVLGPAIKRGFVKQLIDRGFKAYYINDYKLERSVDGSFTYVPPEYNWLFCRDSQRELQRRLRGSNFSIV